jgi:hypothetical protein
MIHLVLGRCCLFHDTGYSYVCIHFYISHFSVSADKLFCFKGFIIINTFYDFL